jgi:hypothetical protein
MASCIIVEETLHVGHETFVGGASTSPEYAVAFEGNGETGYFYDCDTSRENCIVDAMQIYNVTNVTDKHLPSQVVMAWSEDGLKAGLFITQYPPHAIFDFAANRGYCRTNFPPPSKEWSHLHNNHEWSEGAVNLLTA